MAVSLKDSHANHKNGRPMLRLFLLIIVMVCAVTGCSESNEPVTTKLPSEPTTNPRFVGSEACADCHSAEYADGLVTIAFANESDLNLLDQGLILPDQVRVRVLDFDVDGLAPIDLSWTAPMPCLT